MIVVSLSSVPPKLRGFLTKYLWEISTGVYVGNVNARIREALWNRIISNSKDISKAIMVFPTNNQQGFDFYVNGSAWEPVDYEGLKLIMRPDNQKGERRFPEIDRKAPRKRYVVLDLETTGLNADCDRILEIGALRIEDEIEVKRLELIVKTEIPDEIKKLTGIEQCQADNGLEISDALVQLGAFIGGDAVIGYNIRMFDSKFLKKECLRNGVTFPLTKEIDVLDIVRKTFPDLISYHLRDVVKSNRIKEQSDRHRAIADCIMCNEIYKLCLHQNSIDG